MSFSLDAGTLFVGALIFLLAVFVKPIVMYWRGKLVWMWIEKNLLNKQLYDDIRVFAIESNLRVVRTMFSLLYYFDKGKGQFVVRDVPHDVDPISLALTIEQMNKVESKNSANVVWHINMRVRIECQWPLVLTHYRPIKLTHL